MTNLPADPDWQMTLQAIRRLLMYVESYRVLWSSSMTNETMHKARVAMFEAAEDARRVIP